MTAISLDGLRLTGTQTLGTILNATNDLIDVRRLELATAGTAALVLATHRKKMIELTNAATTAVDVAAFAVATADSDPVESCYISNLTGASIAINNGIGPASLPNDGIAFVQSVNSQARVVVISTLGNAEHVSKANGETVDFNVFNDLADGATVTVPAASAANDGQGFGVYLRDGGTTASLAGGVVQTFTNPRALVTYYSDGTSWLEYFADAANVLAGAAAGEIIVFDGTDDVRARPTYPIPVRGATGADTVVLTYRMPTAFEITGAEHQVATNSFDFTVDIDGTPVTGLSGITANATAITTTNATAANTGAAGQRVNVTFANATTATDWYIAPLIRWNGV